MTGLFKSSCFLVCFPNFFLPFAGNYFGFQGCYKKDGCCGHEPQGEDDKLYESSRSDIFLEINKTIESGNQFIDLENKNISDLTPLITLKGIESLYLGDNYIEDLSPLAGFSNLWDLRLGNNYISDLTPLAGLTGLTRLCLEENKISDLSALKELKGLKELRLWENKISDLSPLGGSQTSQGALSQQKTKLLIYLFSQA